MHAIMHMLRPPPCSGEDVCDHVAGAAVHVTEIIAGVAVYRTGLDQVIHVYG